MPENDPWVAGICNFCTAALKAVKITKGNERGNAMAYTTPDFGSSRDPKFRAFVCCLNQIISTCHIYPFPAPISDLPRLHVYLRAEKEKEVASTSFRTCDICQEESI